MKIVRKSEGKHAVVLSLSGNIQGGEDADRFASALQELVEEGRKNILLDMKEVRWVNSTGLGILIGGSRRIREAGGVMKIINLTDRVENLFTVTKLNLVFEVFTDEVAALRSFKPDEESKAPASD